MTKSGEQVNDKQTVDSMSTKVDEIKPSNPYKQKQHSIPNQDSKVPPNNASNLKRVPNNDTVPNFNIPDVNRASTLKPAPNNDTMPNPNFVTFPTDPPSHSSNPPSTPTLVVTKQKDYPLYSAPRCPPFSPAYSATSTSYSPSSPPIATNVKPPRPPATHPINTPPSSQRESFGHINNLNLINTPHSNAGTTPSQTVVKRNLDGDFKMVVRKFKRRKIISHGTAQTGNKLWYHRLPDGVICAYAAKGTPNGPPGYMQPALRSIQDVLKDGNESHITRAIEVTAVLPLKSPEANVSNKNTLRKVHKAN